MRHVREEITPAPGLMTALADAGEPREPRFPHDRSVEIRWKQLSRRAEGEDVGLVTRREDVTPDHIGHPFRAVVALKPVVDEGSAGSQAREARTRITRGPNLRTSRTESRLSERVVAAIGHRFQAEGNRAIRQAGEGRPHASCRGSFEAPLEDA